MLPLLQKYSLSDILVFIIILAIAIKSSVTFFDWGRQRVKQVFNKQHNKMTDKQSLQDKLEEERNLINSLQNNQVLIETNLQNLSNKIDMLIQSDKDDIKSYITREHHYFCYHQHWIDDFSLDCLERRYEHYDQEGGNSFIGRFMDQLRALPNQP